jgi:hypothetical protein
MDCGVPGEIGQEAACCVADIDTADFVAVRLDTSDSPAHRTSAFTPHVSLEEFFLKNVISLRNSTVDVPVRLGLCCAKFSSASGLWELRAHELGLWPGSDLEQPLSFRRRCQSLAEAAGCSPTTSPWAAQLSSPSRWVLSALSARRGVLVVHDGLIDLLQIFDKFFGKVPQKHLEFGRLWMERCCPTVFDTSLVALESEHQEVPGCLHNGQNSSDNGPSHHLNSQLTRQLTSQPSNQPPALDANTTNLKRKRSRSLDTVTTAEPDLTTCCSKASVASDVSALDSALALDGLSRKPSNEKLQGCSTVLDFSNDAGKCCFPHCSQTLKAVTSSNQGLACHNKQAPKKRHQHSLNTPTTPTNVTHPLDKVTHVNGHITDKAAKTSATVTTARRRRCDPSQEARRLTSNTLNKDGSGQANRTSFAFRCQSHPEQKHTLFMCCRLSIIHFLSFILGSTLCSGL